MTCCISIRNKGLRALFDAHRDQVRRLPVDSPFVARDMDTWEDYLQLHRDAFGQPPRRFEAFAELFRGFCAPMRGALI